MVSTSRQHLAQHLQAQQLLVWCWLAGAGSWVTKPHPLWIPRVASSQVSGSGALQGSHCWPPRASLQTPPSTRWQRPGVPCTGGGKVQGLSFTWGVASPEDPLGCGLPWCWGRVAPAAGWLQSLGWNPKWARPAWGRALASLPGFILGPGSHLTASAAPAHRPCQRSGAGAGPCGAGPYPGASSDQSQGT